METRSWPKGKNKKLKHFLKTLFYVFFKVLSSDGRPVPAVLLGNKCDLPRKTKYVILKFRYCSHMFYYL